MFSALRVRGNLGRTFHASKDLVRYRVCSLLVNEQCCRSSRLISRSRSKSLSSKALWHYRIRAVLVAAGTMDRFPVGRLLETEDLGSLILRTSIFRRSTGAPSHSATVGQSHRIWATCFCLIRLALYRLM